MELYLQERTYTWAAPTVTGGLTGGIADVGASITGTLTNPTNAPQVAIYTVTPQQVAAPELTLL